MQLYQQEVHFSAFSSINSLQSVKSCNVFKGVLSKGINFQTEVYILATAEFNSSNEKLNSSPEQVIHLKTHLPYCDTNHIIQKAITWMGNQQMNIPG